MNKLLFLITIFFFNSQTAFAYIDPGTGSIILQAIIGFFAAGIATIYFYWNKLKLLICKLLKKEKKSEKN